MTPDEWKLAKQARKAPTPELHIKLFLSTVADYRLLDATYPLGESINGVGHDTDERRFQVIVHAMLLRKYFQSGDEMNLVNVVESLRKVNVTNTYTDAVWEDLLAGVAATNPVMQFMINDNPALDEDELLEAELYGRYLHADYSKWEITQRAGHSGNDVGVYMATCERSLRVQKLARWIELGIESGDVVISQLE